MRPYSTDLRVKLLAALDRGVSRRVAAETFGVSVATIERYVRRRRETDDVAPRPIPGRPARKTPALSAWLPARLKAHPAATLAGHCEAFEAERGMRVSTATMSRAIARLPAEDGGSGKPGWPLKKGGG